MSYRGRTKGNYGNRHSSGKKVFFVKKTVAVAYYEPIKAATLEGAKRIAKKLEDEGNLIEVDNEGQWEDTIAIEVAENWISGEPTSEVKQVKISV